MVRPWKNEGHESVKGVNDIVYVSAVTSAF